MQTLRACAFCKTALPPEAHQRRKYCNETCQRAALWERYPEAKVRFDAWLEKHPGDKAGAWSSAFPNAARYVLARQEHHLKRLESKRKQLTRRIQQQRGKRKKCLRAATEARVV